MKELKIKLHSIVDLITNSSTVIYTYSNSCDIALKNLFNELKNIFDIEEDIEDIFYISILCKNYKYHDYIIEIFENGNFDNEELEIPKNIVKLLKNENIDFSEINNMIDNIIKDVKYNRIEKQKWMVDAEQYDGECFCYTPDTYISIIPKQEKYEKIAKLFYNLIYSTSHKATRDG